MLSFIPHKVTLPPPLDMTYNVTIYNGTMDNAIYNRQFGDIDGILDLEIILVKGIKDLPQQIKEVNKINNNTTNGVGEGNITTFAKQELDKLSATATVSTTITNNTNTSERVHLENEKDRVLLLQCFQILLPFLYPNQL